MVCNLVSRGSVDEGKYFREGEEKLLKQAEEQNLKEYYQGLQKRNQRGRLGRDPD